jgi:hypothetical protein
LILYSPRPRIKLPGVIGPGDGVPKKLTFQQLVSSLESSDGVHKDTLPLRQFKMYVATRPFLAEYFGHVFGVSLLHIGVGNFDNITADGVIPAPPTWKAGDRVRVTKKGHQKGKEGVIENPNWTMRVKVKMDDRDKTRDGTEDEEVKSYLAEELENVTEEARREATEAAPKGGETA